RRTSASHRWACRCSQEPGAISAVIVLVGQSKLWSQSIPVFLAILATSIVTFYILAAAARVERHLGEAGVRILVRLMGLVLAAMAVQFVLHGISEVWPGTKGQPQAG